MPTVDRVVDRSLAGRQDAYVAEVHSLVEATYRVIATTGTLDPPIRSILAEAGLSNPAFYRHFRSKDELLLVLLDEGRRQLTEYLAHRTERVADPDERVGEWIAGVLAQATDPEAARHTRPFVTQVNRLHEKFPDEQEASEKQLIDQLTDLLGVPANHWAPVIYTLVFGELERYLRTGTQPDEAAVTELTAFVLAGLHGKVTPT
jgi:AcrR family transcriptional regulator